VTVHNSDFFNTIDPKRTSALEKKGSGPIRAASANIERCASQGDYKDTYCSKSLSSKPSAANQIRE
jgi:hypothetical protein